MALLNTPKKRKQGSKLALAAAFLAFLVVLLGAFTRLSDAGLGCPDWPGCYGQFLWPEGTEEIQQAEKLFPDASVDTEKAVTEMVHRYFAGILAVMIGLLAFLGWKNSEDERYPFRLPVLMLFVVVWQAVFGMLTGTLKLWPQVVTFHLIGGMLTLMLTWILAWRLDNFRWKLPAAEWVSVHKLRPWVIVGIGLVFAEIVLGGWTSANYAALACPDLPTCNQHWWPEMDLKAGFNVFQSIGPNYLGGILDNEARVAIHVVHRLGALVTALYLVGFCAVLLFIGSYSVRKAALIIFSALALQLILGVSNILFQAPLPLAIAHTGGGAVLLLTLVFLASRLWTADIDHHASGVAAGKGSGKSK